MYYIFNVYDSILNCEIGLLHKLETAIIAMVIAVRAKIKIMLCLTFTGMLFLSFVLFK